MSNNTFEKWQDALPYIGKEVGVRVVESPDVKGVLTGVDFLLDDKTGEVKKVYLELAGRYSTYEFWECYPVNKVIENNLKHKKSEFPSKLVAAIIGTLYLLVGIAYLISK